MKKIKLDNDQRARLKEIKNKADKKKAVLKDLYDSLIQNCGATDFALGSLVGTVQTLRGHEARKWLKNEELKYSLDTIETRIVTFVKTMQDLKFLVDDVKLQLENAYAEAETCESTFMDIAYKENRKKELQQKFDEWVKSKPEPWQWKGNLDLDSAEEEYHEKLRNWLNSKPKEFGDTFNNDNEVVLARMELGDIPWQRPGLAQLPRPDQPVTYALHGFGEAPRRQSAGLGPTASGRF